MSVKKTIAKATLRAIQARQTRIYAIEKRHGIDINALRSMPVTARRKVQRLKNEIERLQSGQLAHDALDTLMPLAEIGFKVKKGASEGGKNHATPSETKVNWQSEANRIFQNNPQQTKAGAARIIAKKMGGNADTIRQQIKKPSKKLKRAPHNSF